MEQNRVWLVFIIDKTTGEVIGDEQEADPGRYQIIDGRIVPKQSEDWRKILTEDYPKRSPVERFIWLVYDTKTPYLPDLSPASLTRLMYLVSFMGKKQRLIRDNGKPVLLKHLPEVLGVSESSSRAFWDEVREAHLLYLDGDFLCANPDFFRKWTLPPYRVKNFYDHGKYVTKLHIDVVRELYKRFLPHGHKTLSYLFRVLPYVNRQHNILCHNPLEEKYSKIRPMTAKEFCNLIGYGPAHLSRLMQQLESMKFFTYGQVIKQTDGKIFVNPNLYYAGDLRDDVMLLGEFDWA